MLCEDPHPNPPPFRGREHAVIVAGLFLYRICTR